MSDPPRRMLDSVIVCTHCCGGGLGYRVYRVQNVQPDGRLLQSFHHVVEAVGERLAPLSPGTTPQCPDCEAPMRRISPS